MMPTDLDMRLLRNSPVVLYYRRETLADDVAWLRSNAYDVKALDAGTWSDVVTMHHDIAATLGFPDYYGMNLDALNDCVSDLEAPNARLAIVFERYDAFARIERDVAQAVLDILAINSRRFLFGGARLLVFVQSDDPHVTFDPVGATPVMWNGKEWLNANRGV